MVNIWMGHGYLIRTKICDIVHILEVFSDGPKLINVKSFPLCRHSQSKNVSSADISMQVALQERIEPT